MCGFGFDAAMTSCRNDDRSVKSTTRAHISFYLCGRIVFTTSFGIEDQAIAHVIFSQALGIEVATLDTGRLFPETHEI